MFTAKLQNRAYVATNYKHTQVQIAVINQSRYHDTEAKSLPDTVFVLFFPTGWYVDLS